MAYRKWWVIVSLCCVLYSVFAAAQEHEQEQAQSVQNPSARVDSEMIAAGVGNHWLSYGGDYREQRYSPLKDIHEDNVSQLGLAWSFDTDSNRGLEATPLVVNGVMYVSGSWSIVYALNAKNGELIWKYDPKVPKEWAKMACCDVVNRGVALYEGKVFVGTLDARLVALDSATGEVIWETQTADTKQYPYTITGAPRVAKGKVFIGNGGAEYGVRGFVSAFDVNTGELAWRFYTVPGNPADGFETPALASAAKTWSGQWWKFGGGGTVWDSIVYDNELHQLYIGVGNGSPWNREIRSPGGGDNLYLSSIVALNPDTGDYLWHYQETPAESWDYTATQHIMLADMTIEGSERKVIWHAPKNGFFFIIDRTDGKLISAEPFANVNWASHYDLTTGRPVETGFADYSKEPKHVLPSSVGAHNWQPMAYHPGTGLVYIPAIEMMFRYQPIKEYTHQWGHWNTGTVMDQDSADDDLLTQKLMPEVTKGHLLAWDPVKQKEVWRVEHRLTWNGGLLATAGNLLFQGNADKFFAAYSADTGKERWRAPTQTGVIASPVTYRVDGEQYVSVPAGWGGAFGLIAGLELGDVPERSRILTYKLGGSATLPKIEKRPEPTQPPQRLEGDDEVIRRGRHLYTEYCAACHGIDMVSNSVIPDLRRLPRPFYDNFNAIVLDGVMRKAGMVGFKDVLSEEDADALKVHILDQANDDWELRQQPKWWVSFKQWVYSGVAKVLAWISGKLPQMPA
jgi:quinohemoprotein ethanol dehydrogenase